MRVLAYARVSTQEQADSKAGLEAQKAAIAAEARRRGWTIVETIEDAGYSAKDLRRPGIKRALEELQRGRADALVVSKLDRLSRSMIDFTRLMRQAQRQNWALVALDCAVDTTTPAGEAMANVLATFAQFERRLIGQRTREALAQKKAQGERLGRPPDQPATVRSRITLRPNAGKSLPANAEELNRDQIATAHGGAQWYPSTVRAVLAAGG
jgi:DNA invertase Pin-like site-specific DNA recombinase